MPEQPSSSLGIRSEVRPDGTLRISLQPVPLPVPGAEEIVVAMAAAPLHPADISLLAGPADLSTASVSGVGETRSVTFRIPPERMAALGTRMGKPLVVGNEGSGTVVAAGERLGHLLGKPVAVMGGGMVTRHRVVGAANVLPLPDGIPLRDGAAVLINPLTALAMLETMREGGHTALVHTAAASSLGQMLNRICLEDGVGLVSIVRSPAGAALLREQGARHVCDSSAPGFPDDLAVAVAATGATLAFDAVGGGRLAGQILSAMERHALSGVSEYDRYGSKVHKQVYFYGGLDTRPSELDRSYGMAWSVGGWLIFDQLRRMAPGRVDALRARIAAGLRTTFASGFTAELSMTELMEPDNLRAIAARGTGAKFLIDPARPLG